MARYYLHLRNHIDELLDPEGSEHASPEALRKAVIVCARDVIKDDVERGLIDLRFRIDAENEAGEIVLSLPFTHVVSIIPGDGP